MLEHDPLVSEYQHEKFRPREAEALQTLRKVASLVKPIMRQRSWRVSVLTEFFPPEHNLLGLNWNKGQKICLRLRYPGDERQFLPLEEVVDTMLHELCHIVHGPHNEAFHQLWNQLREEHESLLRKGYTGEGFLSKGHKLGSSTGKIPMHEAQRRARAAAEKRRALTAGSGQKLGGAGLRRGQDIRQVIADAAQRRITVTRGCADVHTDRGKDLVEETNRNGFRTKAEEDDANEEAIMLAYIDLVQQEEREQYGESYIPPSKENPAGSHGARAAGEPQNPTSERKSTGSQPANPTSSTDPSNVIDLDDPKSTRSSTESWTCDICTLVNPPSYLCCEACETERPSLPPSSSSPAPPVRPSPSNRTSSASRSSDSRKQHNYHQNVHDVEKSKKKDTFANIKSLNAAIERKAQQQPVGWQCHGCGNWMENHWWTCAACGSMKLTS
ncbi:MAG: hypothetical protein LQ342_007085 [Letrouitia transgressa]|nr:MAG: hypothetical protein LQ342_007085 [Letrouitia transgressa]